MTDIDSRDFFTDNELLADPYGHLAALRGECPVRREKHHDVVMITGYTEALSIYNDAARFSSCTAR
jgi:cytochrome P450 family 150 subfamily A5